jgi:hypothetical protein
LPGCLTILTLTANRKSVSEIVDKRNKVLAELLNAVVRMPLFATNVINSDLFGTPTNT